MQVFGSRGWAEVGDGRTLDDMAIEESRSSIEKDVTDQAAKPQILTFAPTSTEEKRRNRAFRDEPHRCAGHLR